MWVSPLKEVGEYLDFINVMSYDAGVYKFNDTRNSKEDGYNPLEAYKAFKAIYKGKINMGIQIPPEGWGSKNVITEKAIELIAKGINKK